MVDKVRYLQRIGIESCDLAPNLRNLKLLQKQHLLNIPFENLDIHWKRRIKLKIDKFYNKIVENMRGGFCYELNGLFNELLKEIGYKTKIVSARVSNEEGGFGKQFDHLAILVKIDGEDYLTDVGFGDFIIEPLKLSLDLEQKEATTIYMIRRYKEDYYEVVKKNGKLWQSEYIFQDLERSLTEFEEMNQFHQDSESHFSKGKVCSIMTKNGRKTLTGNSFSISLFGKKTEAEFTSSEEFKQILSKEFNIEK